MLQSKTIWAGLAVVVLGFLETFNVTDLAAYIPDSYEPLVFSVVGFLMLLLRMVTNKPLSAKTPTPPAQ